MTQPDPSVSSAIIERNIGALLEKRREAQRSRSLQDRIADRMTSFTGSMGFVYLHLLVFGMWIMLNSGLFPVKKFDPSLVMLAMAASVEAIFLSTFVLISQNRMQRLADERADLNLHISLLAEHEVTQLIKLASAIAARLDVREAHDPHLEELGRDVKPEKVIEEMNQRERPGGETRTPHT